MLNGVRWLIPDRVVIAEFSGVLRYSDFVDVREQFTALISDQHLHSFYTLYDTTLRTGMDWRLSDLPHVRDLGYKHPRLRSLVIIDAKPHPLASVVGKMAVHFHGLTLQLVRTQDEALTHLHKIDPTLRASISR
jgi:hypothetical protein